MLNHSPLIISFLFFFSSCGQNWDSHTTDSSLLACSSPQASEDPGQQNFINAFKIIKEKCINCHQGYHDAWTCYTSQSDWFNKPTINPGAPLVVKGDSSASALILRLDSGMPPPDSPYPLTREERETLERWIDHIF